MANEQKTYDITEYSKKALDALRMMEKTQQPGQLTTGGKTDVVRHIREDIKALMEKGYTAQQVSDALKQDVFSILPKSITEVVNGKKQGVKKTRQPAQTTATTLGIKPTHAPATKAETKQVTKQATTNNTQGNSGTSGTFEIKPDTPNVEL